MQKIKPATLSDVPELLFLLNSAYRGEGSKKGWTSEADLLAGSIRTDAATLKKLIADELGDIFIYRDDAGKLVGCVHLQKNGEKLYLGMLSVMPDQQGKGIGKQFLRKAEIYAKEKGCHTIYMQVISVRTELNEWYFRHGYQATGERKAFDVDKKYGVPTQTLEFMFLEKKLN